MPFESDRQRLFMFVRHPRIARRWVKEAKRNREPVTKSLISKRLPSVYRRGTLILTDNGKKMPPLVSLARSDNVDPKNIQGMLRRIEANRIGREAGQAMARAKKAGYGDLKGEGPLNFQVRHAHHGRSIARQIPWRPDRSGLDFTKSLADIRKALYGPR